MNATRLDATETTPSVTVAVVPHERFSPSRACLTRLFAATRAPHRLLYVDGGSPPQLARHLEAESRRRGFSLHRVEHYLAPNVARNLALGLVETPYVVFLDNDVLVQPGWLTALVRCAEETGAGAVGPLYCHGEPEGERVHMAGSELSLHEHGGRVRLHERLRFMRHSVSEVQHELRREPTQGLELHCLLLRTDAIRELGGFDEEILSTCNVDLCLSLQRAGHTLYFEPWAVVTYSPPPPLDPGDRDYFRLRWSRDWNVRTIARYREKWSLADDDPTLKSIFRWAEQHRRRALFPSLLDRWRHGRLGRRPAIRSESRGLGPISQETS